MPDIIDTLIYDRTEDDVKAGNQKGMYTANDLNRLEAAITFVADKLNQAGESISVTPGIEWTYNTSVTPARINNALLTNIKKIRATGAIFDTTPELPDTMDNLTWEIANNIEKVLWDVNSFLEMRNAVYIPSGTAISGATVYLPTIDYSRPTGQLYVLTVVDGYGYGLYREGDTVTVTSKTVAGQHFLNWVGNVTFDDATSETAHFTMPANNVTVTAKYTASYHTITVTSDGHGTAFASSSTAEMGATITLSQTPNTDYVFVKWNVVDGGITITNNQFTMPDCDVTVSAVYHSALLNVPTVTSTGLTYNGTAQTVTVSGYSASRMTRTGTIRATNAGTYTITYTPINGYMWKDRTTTPQDVQWSIDKATPSAISVTVTSGTTNFDNYNTSGTLTVARDGDGSISATSSKTSVCRVSVSDNVVTANAVRKTSGNARVTISVGEGTNYLAPSSTVAVDFTANFLPEYTIAATLDPVGSGTISGTGVYVQGETVTLSVSGSNNYRVKQWVENGTVVSTAETYSFTASSNRTLSAVMTNIPSGYEELESVNNTGYVLCPGVVAIDTDSVVLVDAKINGYYNNTSTSYSTFLSRQTSSSWYAIVTVRNGSAYYGYIYLVDSNGNYSAKSVGDYHNRLHYVADFSGNTLKIFDESDSTEYGSVSFGSTRQIDFGVPYGITNRYTKNTIYRITAHYASTGEVYADLVPVKRTSDSLIGYYDVIGRRFISPITGTFS